MKVLQRHAIMAVDPGGTTGVAAGHVDVQPTLRESMDSIVSRKAVEVEGGWLEQARQLEAMVARFVYTANVECQLPLSNIHLVLEDFVLRMPATTTNLTSIWVMAGAVARLGPAITNVCSVEYQQPSQAKGFATNERLRRWGLWERGSEHKRDAWRHWALKLNKVVA